MASIDSLTRGEKTAQAVRSAAIRLFFVHGYEATTLRRLASEVGITVGSVYNHIESKEDLLFSIMSEVMRDLQDGMDTVLARRTDPVAALRAAAEFHVIFHARRAEEVFIGNSELRRLPPARRAAVIEARDAYELTFRRLLDDGMRAGVFSVSDPRLIVYAIIAMGTHVADWYQPGGPQTLEHIAAVYADFILSGLRSPDGARPAERVDALAAPDPRAGRGAIRRQLHVVKACARSFSRRPLCACSMVTPRSAGLTTTRAVGTTNERSLVLGLSRTHLSRALKYRPEERGAA